MAFKFDDSYIGAAIAFGKKAREAKTSGDTDQAQAMMANKASSAIGGALTAVNGVTGILNTALQSANIQDTSKYEGQIDLLSQAGNRNYYDYGQLAEDMSNTDFSVNTDYDVIRGMGGKGVTKEKVGAVGSSTLNGAMTGLQVGGPWGAAIGAVVGAGSAIGGILAGDAKARIQQGFLDANADRATTDAMLNFNAGLEEIGNRRNRFNLANYAAKGGKIEIKKENEGKFTAAAKRHNMTVQEFAKHVLAKKNADKYSATMRKRANFARNAAGWKHANGGNIQKSAVHSYAPGGGKQSISLAEWFTMLKQYVTGKLQDPNTADKIVNWYHNNAEHIPPRVHQVIYDTIKDTGISGEMEDLFYNFIPNAIHSRINPDNAFLMAPEQQQKKLEQLGFTRDDANDYGLVKSAVQRYRDVTGRDVPVYKLGNDDAVREDLTPLDNRILYNSEIGKQYPLGDTASYPTRYYRDSSGNLYYKSWDFFDHGNYSRRDYTKDDLHGTYFVPTLVETSQRYGNLLDVAGNPFVKTTGYIKVNPEDLYDAATMIVGVNDWADRESDEAIINAIRAGKYDAKTYATGGQKEEKEIDYSGIVTTNNRPYNTDYISYIDTSLRKGGLNDYQRAAVLANIIEESGGNPFAEGPGGFYGLLQWSGARYPKTQEKDIYKEIDNQVANILSTAKNSTDKMSWTHGGKGSGYNSLTDAMKAYNGKTLDEVMRGYTLGYVRPAGGLDSLNNRLKVAQQLYNLKGFTQHAQGGELNTSNMNIYNTHGGYFNPGLISIDAGGTHEQNPNGGVQLGVDSQGIPNLVEEGETVYDDYVFSDRLKPSASELKKFNLPDKFVGKTFAELSDVLGEEAKERPNDAISNDGLGVMLDRLIACQEVHKQAQEERSLRRELNKLSPEELVALGSQLQQMSDQQVMAQQGMQQYMPQMEAPMMQQMPVDDQSQMIMPEQQPMMANGGLLNVYKDGTDNKDDSDTKVGYPRYDYGFNLPLPMRNYRVYRHWYPSYARDFSSLGNIDIPSFNVDLGPRFDYGAGLATNPSDLNIGYGNYHVYRTNGQTGTQSAPAAGNDGTSSSSSSAGQASASSPVASRPSLGLPEAAPITGSAVDTDASMRRRGFGLTRLPGITPEGYDSIAASSGMQPVDSPSVTSLARAQVGTNDTSDSNKLLPTIGRYAGAAGNALSALDIALQSPDRVSWNRIQPNYVAGNLDLQKMRYTPIDWQIGANQVNANAAATRRAISNAGMGPAVGATLLAANYGNNQNLGNVINQTQLANDQRRAQTIGVNNQAENLMRNFDFRRNAMNTQIANQFAQYNNQLDMDETLRNIQFENDKYAALSHAISNSLNDISNIGRENFAMNQINSNAALYYGVGANGWAYYKGYDGVDWKVDPQSGRRVLVTDKSEIPAQQQKCGGKLKK